MVRPLIVFISLIPDELEAEREAIKDTLEAISLTRPWAFEYTPASSEARKCDIFVLIVAQHIPRSIKKEYGLAVMYDKPRYLFLKNVDRSAVAEEFVGGIGAKWINFDDTSDLCPRLQRVMLDELIRNHRSYRLDESDLAKLNELSKKLAISGATSRVPSARRYSHYTGRPHLPPATRHKLFGRDKELNVVVDAVCNNRTVLVHGLAGVGKTALAAHAARKVISSFADGVLWLDVGEAPLPAICDAISRSLGVEEIRKLAPETKARAIHKLLAVCKLLVVLDDVVQVATVGGFLRDCLPQDMPVLVTSRYHHLGLDVDLHLEPLTRDEAIILFNDRAGLTGAHGMVSQICALLGDHPLALVVAAGRVRQQRMPMENLLMRLQDERSRLPLLRLGAEKDYNVWASLSVSYETLAERERQVFTDLAACFGDKTGLEFLAELCGFTEQECEDALGHLVARSLTEREGRHFRLHGLVQSFGRAILKEQLVEVNRRVVAATSAYIKRYSEPKPEHFDKLEAELTNILGAIKYAYGAKDWPSIIWLVDALSASKFLGLRGHWAEATHLGEIALEAARQVRDWEAIARFSHYTAAIHQHQGNYAEASRLYRKALDIYRRLGNQTAVASCLRYLGEAAQGQGEHAEARRLYYESLEISRKFGEQHEIASTLHHLGKLVQSQGEYAEANKLYQESLETRRKLGDQQGIARSVHQLATLAQAQGDYTEAKRLFQESLEISRDLNDPRGIAWTLHQLGTIAYAQGNYIDAKSLYRESLTIKEVLGHQVGIAWTLLELGTLARTRGDHSKAYELFQESLGVAKILDHQKCIYRVLCQLGILAQTQGDLVEAHHRCHESLEIATKLQDKWGMAQAFLQLGALARMQGDYTTAHQFYQGSLDKSNELSDQRGIGDALYHLGMLAQEEGDYTEAGRFYQKSLMIKKRLNDRRGLAITYAQLALLEERLGNPETACQMADQASKIFQTIDVVHSYEHIQDRFRQLDERQRAARE